jgi:hypothetical protein
VSSSTAILISKTTAWPPDVCTSAYVRATQVGVPGTPYYKTARIVFVYATTSARTSRPAVYVQVFTPTPTQVKTELDTAVRCGALQLITSSATQLPTWRGHRHHGTTRRLSRTLGLAVGPFALPGGAAPCSSERAGQGEPRPDRRQKPAALPNHGNWR